jgi:hypothetical protein
VSAVDSLAPLEREGLGRLPLPSAVAATHALEAGARFSSWGEFGTVVRRVSVFLCEVPAASNDSMRGAGWREIGPRHWMWETP